jgi:hypothetical protein
MAEQTPTLADIDVEALEGRTSDLKYRAEAGQIPVSGDLVSQVCDDVQLLLAIVKRHQLIENLCDCGYGGVHEPENARCSANRALAKLA